MNKAIVLGAPHHNTLGIIRSLGIKGIKPDVYQIARGVRKSAFRTKYVGEVQLFDTNEEAVEYLVAHKPTEHAVLYASGDPISACIDRNYDRLKGAYVFFNAHGNLSQLMNKESMCALAKEVGLTVPQHIVHALGDALPEDIAYPCITKAISSIDGGKSDTTICQNREELEAFLATPNLCPKIQIEKFIRKEFEFQFLGVSLNEGETIVIPGHSHIDRPNGIQNTFYFDYVANDDSFREVLEKTKDFIRRTHYSGIFSVEFLHGKDGVNYFLEMNFRNDGNAICVTDAGYDLPYIWYAWATGGDYQQVIADCTFRPVKYCPEYFYTMECGYCEVPVWTWLKNLVTADSYTEYYKGDSPFFWLKFLWFAFLWVGVRRTHYKLGIRQIPKESIG